MSAASTPLEGPITVTRTGMGFFPMPEGTQDLLIPREELNGAFQGDTVRVEPLGQIDGRKTGRVTEIVTRARTHFVGLLTYNEDQGLNLLMPDWKKMYTPFAVTGSDVPLGHKALLRFDEWPKGSPYPRGTVVEIIGPAGVHETEMRALALAQGFRSEFPPSVAKEAKELETTGHGLLAEGVKDPRRKDFRSTTTFTIDPFDAKDFDDALSVKKLPDGNFEIGVHIADVSHFVRPGMAIDAEARNRATSVYMVDRTIPMLPHVLSTDLCSLNPDEDRLSVSAVFVLRPDATVVSSWFGETSIHSDKRFTYEEAQGVLDTKEGPLLEELTILKDLARQIRKRRVAKGAIEFDTAEVKVELDEVGKPIAIKLKVRQETNLLIEDFMLLANEAVAEQLSEFTKKSHLPQGAIYRVHDVPDAERIVDLAAFLKVLGYTLPVLPGGRVKGTDLNALLEQAKGKPEEYLIKMATLRSMSKATYTTKNIGHFGLAFSHYTHFTSPIRRYPDLLVHRMLKHFVHGEPLSHGEMEEFERLALHSSEREVGAAEAERDSIKMKQVEYMAGHVGEEFDAVISGASERGLFVELSATRAEGLIRISAIGDDYYTYDPKRYRLIGTRTKKEYALGDPVRVKLTAARLFERELDFALVQK